ncbi:NVEALA domain-containing protein [Petrimonas sulfuriphila]|uniref:NVEALA domain-containing protein n=1 Tax=Petrimonas sulfuriphila TaxID=285070 RepID=UPI003F515A5B
MKKKLLSGIFALALLVATGYGVSQSMKSDANLSDLALSNVEALAQDESGGGTLWTRTDGDCTYTFTGRAGSTISITIAGISVTLTIGADGTATYTYGDGKTDCASGGNQQCTARYCPSIT